MNHKSYFALAAFLSVLLCLSAYGQRLDGTLRGTVKDPSGAVIPNADVTVTNQTTAVKQTTKSTSTGQYVFPNLQVGTYTVGVTAKGFKEYIRKDVEVLPNQVISADASLGVAAGTQVVEVTSGGEIVQTDTSQLSNDFGSRAVSELPTPGLGGGPLNLALLAPNTTDRKSVV